MPNERREIIFAHEELCAATRNYLQRRPDMMPEGTLSRMSLSKGKTIFATAEFITSQPAETLQIRLGAAELGAALTLHCLTRKVPLPKKGERTLQIVGGNLALVVTLKAPRQDTQTLAENEDRGATATG